MRILGLDPGTRVAGYGVVDTQGSSLKLIAAGTFRVPAGAAVEIRLARIAKELRETITEWKPDAAAVEDVFVKLNPRAALAIGQARGALLAVLGEHGIPVHSYPPASIKKAVTGNGRASKAQVARMVGAILGDSHPRPQDATDALATALAHAFGHKAQLLADQ